jgi:ubiquinone/menaquinone biosynthesis C-methylase UbiE
MNKKTDPTNITRKRYNRIAPVYDLMEGLVEKSHFSKWRELLWSKIEGKKILEIGVGTGKNFLYYPIGKDITAIDFSDRMLNQAKLKAEKLQISVNLQQMDVQDLEFEDDAFDTVVATFVFYEYGQSVSGNNYGTSHQS